MIRPRILAALLSAAPLALAKPPTIGQMILPDTTKPTPSRMVLKINSQLVRLTPEQLASIGNIVNVMAGEPS